MWRLVFVRNFLTCQLIVNFELLAQLKEQTFCTVLEDRTGQVKVQGNEGVGVNVRKNYEH